MEGSGNGYLKTVCDYVHLNPVRAGLLGREDRLIAYPWNSLMWYLAAPEHRPSWIRVDRLLGEHGIQEDSAEGRHQFERQMEARRLEGIDPERLAVFRRGWCLGGEEFREKMLELMEGKLGPNHSGELHRETAEQKAERIIGEELRRLGWSEADLVSRMKNDPGKLVIASRLRTETTLSIKWIAARLEMGTYKSAKSMLHKAMAVDRKSCAGTGSCAQLQFQPTV